MVEGPFGLPRPFAEERELPIHIILEYDTNVIGLEEFENEANRIVENLDDQGLLIDEYDVAVLSNERWVLEIILSLTNVGIQTLEDIRREANSIRGYKNLTVSTVSSGQIRRMI